MPEYRFLEDSDLIDLLKAGNEPAFTEIYNRYWKKLLAIAYNHTKDKSSAEEIVQEVFISLWNRRNQLKIQTVSNYLATATKFTVFKSFYRARKKQSSLIEKLDMPTFFQSDEEKIDAKFLQQYINGFVEKLPEKCRLVFKYSREAELSIPEIAVVMNISEKTVEAHLTKALKSLRLNLRHSGSHIILTATLLEILLKKLFVSLN